MASLPSRPQNVPRGKRPALLVQAPEDRSMIKFIRQKYANLSYRDDSSQEWTRLEPSFESRWSNPNHPEPLSVQEVVISTTGITVRQYDDEYDPQVNENNVKVVTQPQYGWEVRFAHRNISHIVISEYEMDSWVEGQRRLGMKKQFLVLRFKCARITASRDVSVLPMDDEEELDRLYHEMDTDRPVIEEVAAVDDMDRPAREYPLAKLCGGPDSLAGKEIRLAFLKGSSHHRNKYLWAWPALVNFLAGQTYKHVKGDNKNKMPLDEWARENKDRLPAAKLTEVGILGGSEWIVERKGQSGSAESSAAGGQPAVSVAAPARAIPSKRPWEKMDLAETLASRKARAEARLLAAVQGTIAAQKEEKAARAEWSAIVDEEKGLGGR